MNKKLTPGCYSVQKTIKRCPCYATKYLENEQWLNENITRYFSLTCGTLTKLVQIFWKISETKTVKALNFKGLKTKKNVWTTI